MNITLTITLAPEVLNLFSSLLQGLTPAAAPKEVKKTNGQAKTAEVKQIAENTVKTTDVTVEQVRKAVITKKDSGKGDDVKKILTKFEAASVTALDPKHYAEFLTEVEAL